MLLTMNWRNEIKNRISMIDVIKENLTDVEAELEEVRKRNPLVKTKSENERSGSCLLYTSTANCGFYSVYFVEQGR